MGDELSASGVLSIPSNNTLFNCFNYRKYLYNHRIYYILNANKIKKIKRNTSIFYDIKNKIISRIKNFDTKGYVMTFILGNKDMIDNDMLQMYRENGISHLFAISGMHVNFIVSILVLIINKTTYHLKYKYGIISIFLIFYSFLTSYSLSVLRVVVMFVLTGINVVYNLKIKTIDIILLTLIVLCIINPFILYDVGFQFSYITSSSLIIFSKKIKGTITNNLYSSYVCFLVSFPIVIFYFYQINIVSCFFNLIMIPFVSLVIFPFSIIVFIFPKFIVFYNLVISILEYVNRFFNNFKIFLVVIPKSNIIILLLLYLIIYFCIRNIKMIVILFFLLFVWKYSFYLFEEGRVLSMDVGQGDSILLILPYRKATILIDTGGKVKSKKENWQKRKKEYLFSSNTIVYLKSIGISNIDYLILTHGDYDHMGEAINLVNNFKVEKVIFNCGEFNDLEKELIKVLDKKKIKYYSCVKELSIDNNKLYFLQTKEYDNENDNSSVIYTDINGYKFMGDASITTEKEIINKYNLPDIDVLKVGHHGSRTSSGEEFINEINPKYSIISVGKNNRYGHPNKEVLDNLGKSKIYRTDQDGSIMFKFKNNKLKIETCTP